MKGTLAAGGDMGAHATQVDGRGAPKNAEARAARTTLGGERRDRVPEGSKEGMGLPEYVCRCANHAAKGPSSGDQEARLRC